MKKTIIKVVTSISLLCGFTLKAQVIGTDTIQYRGDINKYINIVILGDGFTSSQQIDFIENAKKLTNYIFSQSPWDNYSTYCNVFAIKVASSVSGAKHPNTAGDCAGSGVPVSTADTYFGSTFDYGGIHRLVVPTKSGNISTVLANNFPNYDQVLVLTNSPYYGGSGGQYATSTLETSANEILVHEVGHSFANLADEYWAGASYAAEKLNMTQQSNATLVKWKNWIGTGNVGVYPHAESPTWYRPHQTCKMRYLGYAFCNVCKEATIEKIHSLVNPIVKYSPNTGTVGASTSNLYFKLTELMKPTPNSLKTEWKLNGNIIAKNKDSLTITPTSLNSGNNTLTVTVVDTNLLVRTNNHSTVHFSSVTWTIQKTLTGTDITSLDNKIAISVFPNPAQEVLNVKIEAEYKNKTSLEIISNDGKYREPVYTDLVSNYTSTVNISHLASGTYTLLIKTDEFVQRVLFVKE